MNFEPVTTLLRVDSKHRAWILGLPRALDASRMTLNHVSGFLKAPGEISEVELQCFVNSARLANTALGVEEVGQGASGAG